AAPWWMWAAVPSMSVSTTLPETLRVFESYTTKPRPVAVDASLGTWCLPSIEARRMRRPSWPRSSPFGLAAVRARRYSPPARWFAPRRGRRVGPGGPGEARGAAGARHRNRAAPRHAEGARAHLHAGADDAVQRHAARHRCGLGVEREKAVGVARA